MADGPVTVGAARPPRRARACSSSSCRRRCHRPRSTSRSSGSGSSASPSSRWTARGRCRRSSRRRLGRVLAPVAAGAVRRLDAGLGRPGGCRRWRRPCPGDRKPACVRVLAALPPARCRTCRVWWAATDAPEEYEDALLDAFAAGVPEAERAKASRAAASHAVGRPPHAVRASASRRGSPTRSCRRSRRPSPCPSPGSSTCRPPRRDGARDEAKRGRRPAPGRGTGRIASAAAYAAQGSPRKVHGAGLPLARGPRPAGGGARRARRPAAGRDQAHRDRAGARRPQGERRVPRRARGAGVPGGADQVARGEAQDRGRRRADGARRVRGLGARVRVEVDGEETTMQVVASAEANSREGRISTVVAGRARRSWAARSGDVVTIVTPGGNIATRCSRSPDAGTCENRRPVGRRSGFRRRRGGDRGRGVRRPSWLLLALLIRAARRSPPRRGGASSCWRRTMLEVHRRAVHLVVSFPRSRWLGSGEEIIRPCGARGDGRRWPIGCDGRRVGGATSDDAPRAQPLGGSASLCSTAHSAACVRDARPSLPRMFDT